MRLPTPLLRNNQNVYKNNFGHILILAGSKEMLGAAALTGLAAMRSGAGLVTLGVPESLNDAIQEKTSNVIMTLPLKETKDQSLALSSLKHTKEIIHTYSAVALGPGLSKNPSTQKLVIRVTKVSPAPLVIDADGLNALKNKCDVLLKTKTEKILTPHPGEMARMTGIKKEKIEKDPLKAAEDFSKKYKCTLLLKGHHSVVASHGKKHYINKTGNAGLATAGSGDVLTGMIAAFLGQGLSPFEAAKWGAYLHGKAGDLAARKKTQLSMIATDIIDFIPNAVKAAK